MRKKTGRLEKQKYGGKAKKRTGKGDNETEKE